MYAPQIKNLLSFGRSYEGESALNAPSRAKLDELFAVLDRFEPVGDDNLHKLWLRAERGPISAFGNIDEWLEEGEVSSREEFESWWLDDFPREEKWFLLAAAEYQDYRTVCVNHRVVIQIDPHKTGEWVDLTEFLQWAIDAARATTALVASVDYPSASNPPPADRASRSCAFPPPLAHPPPRPLVRRHDHPPQSCHAPLQNHITTPSFACWLFSSPLNPKPSDPKI